MGILWAKTMTVKTAVVVGGGIAGCSTAHALAKRGLQVTLIERHSAIAGEASGNPLAMLYPRLSGDDMSSRFALLGYLHSLALFKTLDLSPLDFESCGMLQLGFNARELARIEKVSSRQYPTSVLKYVDRTEASALAGIDITHDALYFPNAAWVKPQRLCQRLTQHDNISVITSHHVTSISRNDQVFEVHANDRLSAKADIVVIASANDTQQLCPSLPLHTQAVRGQVSILKAADTSTALKAIVCSDGYLSPAAYRHQSENAHCLGATFAAEPITTQTMLTIENKDHLENLAKLNNLSPKLHQALHGNITGGRVSLRCTSDDYWPLVGQLLDSTVLQTSPPRPSAMSNTLPWIDGLYMNIAHGSKGFTSAPLCAELLAAMICNETLPISDDLAGLLNPNRFLLREMGLKRLAKNAAFSAAC